MNISEAIIFLTKKILKEMPKQHIDSQVIEYLRVISSIDIYLEKKRLDEWENEVRSITIDKSTRLNPMNRKYITLIDAIFEFGSYNLYCAFKASKTRKEFKKLLKLFSKYGITVDLTVTDSDFNGW